MVKILYTEFNFEAYTTLYLNFLKSLPNSVIEKANHFKRWQDRQAFIFGRLLLSIGLKEYGYNKNCLNELKFNAYGKPYIDKKINFNISHSGGVVICAFSPMNIGIDIEEIKAINITDFESIVSHQEKKLLNHSPNPLESFYKLWTIKESVVKGEGKGLSIPLSEVKILSNGDAQYGENIWYVHEINLSFGYSCHLSMEKNLKSIDIKKINLG